MSHHSLQGEREQNWFNQPILLIFQATFNIILCRHQTWLLSLWQSLTYDYSRDSCKCVIQWQMLHHPDVSVIMILKLWSSPHHLSSDILHPLNCGLFSISVLMLIIQNSNTNQHRYRYRSLKLLSFLAFFGL